MPPRSLLKFKNYEVHAITTAADGRLNANIATWVMQSAMKGRYLSVALHKPDYTLELALSSKILNVNLLSEPQKRHVQRLGRQSGRAIDKFSRLPHALDARGCPYLTEAVGYAACELHDTADSGDHLLLVCRVLGQVVLHPQAPVLTLHYLQEMGYSR
jgi:flavin reductase (DIM6/NTAB) family NADH-FMN oxidoreductase RutF